MPQLENQNPVSIQLSSDGSRLEITFVDAGIRAVGLFAAQK
jgi:hypothetical protein